MESDWTLETLSRSSDGFSRAGARDAFLTFFPVKKKKKSSLIAPHFLAEDRLKKQHMRFILFPCRGIYLQHSPLARCFFFARRCSRKHFNIIERK